MSDPITREETYLAALSGESVNLPDPITRTEMYLAYLNGMAVNIPAPITRKDFFLYTLCQQGVGGGGVTIRNQNKTITANGQYGADSGYTGLGTVTVAVPQEEPVVEPLDVTENGTYNPPAGVDGYGPVTVNVEASGSGDDVARAIADRSITEYSDDEITTIGNQAFQNCFALKSVNTPNVTFLGTSSFDSTGLEICNFPNVAHCSNYTFRNCKEMKAAYMPKLINITSGMFSGDSLLEEVDFSSVVGTGSGGLNNCPLLKKSGFP